MILTLLSIVIISCNNSTDTDYNKNYESLTNLDAKQVIALGNEWRDSAPQIKTHITSTEVIMEFPDGRVVKKTLPESLMYIAVAPYINTTHECTTHYPSSCEGELFEKSVKLTAKDENGNIYCDGNITTLKHGFFEIWLPRDKNIKLSISYNSLSSEETIPTKSDSRTCITTIKLK
jgi:hypothetical protein